MKSEETETAGLQGAKHFTKCLRYIGFWNMHDGIEGHDGGPGAIFNVEPQHVSLPEFDGWAQFARLFEHAGRKVDAENVHASVVQVARHMARPATEIANAAASFDAGCEIVEN